MAYHPIQPAPQARVRQPAPTNVPQEQTRSPQRTYWRKHGIKPLAIILTTVALGLLSALFLSVSGVYGYYKYFQTSGRISPGVYVLDTALDSMTIADAAITIHKTWNIDHKISVSDGAMEKTIAPGLIGLSVDPLLTARGAFKIGRSGEIIPDLQEIIASYQHGFAIVPVVLLDEDDARAGLESLVPFFSQTPKNATIKLEGTELVPIPGEPGYTIHIEDTLKGMATDPLKVMVTGSALIFLKPVPPPIDDVTPAIQQAQELLETDFTINAYDPISNEYSRWTPTPQDVSQWIVIEQGDQGFEVTLDQSRVVDYLEGLSESIGPERRIDVQKYGDQLTSDFLGKKATTVLINHNPTTYIVQPGDTLLKIGWNLGFPFYKILQVNPGIDADSLRAGTELVIPSKDDMLPLPIIPGKRIVININAQRLLVYQDGEQIGKHLISTGIDRSPTQPGVFQVLSHQRQAYASVWELTMPHFLGIYEAWPGFMNGIHGLPTLKNGNTLWANVLGKPASYGCIILDSNAAAWLYKWAEDGVIVEIQP